MQTFEIVIVGDGYYEGRRVRPTREGYEPTGEPLAMIRNLAELDGGDRAKAGEVVMAREAADCFWFSREAIPLGR